MTKYQLYEQVIRHWIDDNPKEALNFREDVRGIKETRLNKLSATKGLNLRWGLSLPQSLYTQLKKVDPDFLTTKANLHNFMRMYPLFRIPFNT